MAENTGMTVPTTAKLTSLSVSEVLTKGWEFTKIHFFDLLIMMIIVLVATAVPSTLAKAIFGRGMLGSIVNLLLQVWNAYLTLGMMRYVLSLMRGKKMEYMEAFNNMDKFAAFLMVYVIFAIAAGVGLVFFVVPGIIIMLMYGFSIVLAADGKANGMDAFTMSSKMTEGHKMELFVYMVVSAVMVIVGFMFLIIPGFIAAMVSSMGFYLMYEYLLEKMPASATK